MTQPDPVIRRWPWPFWLAMSLVLILIGAYGYGRIQDLELQLAHRMGEMDAASRSARGTAVDTLGRVSDLGQRIEQLETKAKDTQNQQLALAGMYQELARSQDERLYADLEQTLLLAQQQLYLAGNVRAAILGLEAAEARLARMNRPQLRPLRDALLHDLERLRLLPVPEVAQLNARLDALLQEVDRFPLAFDAQPATARKPAVNEGAAKWMGRLSSELWVEFKSLVQIRRLDSSDQALLAPGQIYFLRENLRLRLLSARLAALSRDEMTWKSDLGAAQAWLKRYFETQAPAVIAALSSLKSLSEMSLSLKGADLSESLKALRALRPKYD